MSWTAADIDDQTGRTFLVTGATSGLGLETVRALAGAGASVVLAARNADKTAGVMAEVRGEHPDADLEHLPLDLADLSSVASAAEAFLDAHDRLDVLINNAGVMATPERRTVDGFELQLGTNHLGHFALTGRLLPVLLATSGSRVVTVSSGFHHLGRMDFDDLNWRERRYQRWGAYAQSKLANLLFTFELQARLAEAGAPTIAAAAHPGYASTHLQARGPQMQGGLRGRVMGALNRTANRLVAQDAAAGAWPQLYAATAPDVGGGSYWGPDGLGESRGHPAPARVNRRAQRVGDAHRLWESSKQLTGVAPDLPARPGVGSGGPPTTP